MKKLTIALATLSLFALSMGSEARKAPAPPQEQTPQFNRAQMLVMNLNRGPKSAGFYISQSLRTVRDAIKGLERAQRQVEQADKEYAKSKGKPDDRYLAEAADRIKKAVVDAQALENELQIARDELKSSITQSLVSD